MPSAGGAVNDGNVERQCLRPCAEQSGHIVEVVLACLNQVVGDDAPRFAETRVVGHGEVIGPALFLKRLRRGGRWRVAPGGIEREMDVVPDPGVARLACRHESASPRRDGASYLRCGAESAFQPLPFSFRARRAALIFTFASKKWNL